MNAPLLRSSLAIIVGLGATLAGFGQGETCATALPVTPGTYTGDGPSSGAGIDQTCFNFGGINGDWYMFTPVVDGTFTVGSCFGGTDTRLSVFTGSCGALSCYGSSDDFCPMYTGGNSYASEVSNLVATAGVTYYIQFDDNWVQSSYNWYLNFFCANAPSAEYTIVPDCANNIFSVQVNITSLGSAASVDITNNGGAPTVSGVGLGQQLVGPFTAGTPVQLTLVNNSDPGCDGYSPSLVNFTCPILSCGPDNYTHCYGNGENFVQVFQGTTSYPIMLIFNSGAMYQFGGDLITIYDGLDNTGTVLYSGYGVNGNMAGISVTSTNPDDALTMVITSDGFTSCADFGVTGGPLDYTVGCLDCTPPAVTGYTVNTDCDAQQYTVDVSISSIGTDPEVEISNNVGVASSTASAPGVVTAGPFPVGVPTIITLVNDQNALCNVVSQELVNTFCPINITCGQPSFEDQYCYNNNDSRYWIYHNTSSTQPLALLFSQGYIESSNYDHIRIYSGEDNTGTLLWENGSNTMNLAGILAISNPGESIYMEMSSDFTVCCVTNSFGVESEWLWTVGCLDCVQANVSYDVVLDCQNSQFFVATTVNALGSDVTPTITNNGGAPSIPITAAGTYNVGPFAFGSQVRVRVESDENNLCSVQSPTITNAPCPVVDCGPDHYTYCFGNYADTAFVYQSASTFPIAAIFNAGSFGMYGDTLKVYDGANYLAPLIYNNTYVDDMAGQLFTSTNPANALTFRFISDFFYSCQDQQYTALDWDVSCLDCTNPEVEFTMIPDCQHHGFNVQLDVASIGVNAPLGLMVANSYDTDTIFNIQTGTSIIGPFPVDEEVKLTVMNANNPLCRSVSPIYYYPSDSCIITACAATGTEYCYTNHDTAWFTYTSGNANPITLQFGWGQMLVNDYIQIYNGLDTAAQLVYMGNQGGNLQGLAITSNNADNALTLLVISSQVGSCATGQAISSYWTVGCGLVGISDVPAGDFAMFPNPTNGELQVRLPNAVTGRVHMDVIDATGRTVRTLSYSAVSGTNARMDLSELPTGTYMVRMTGATWNSTHPLQVLR